ncbi:MAG: UDP-N-acetylmuramoyl-tripeptide--D-alanyl-D-alanine ligase [Rhodospirillales bacterium]|nr:MAG: UDP-N-acetylmuramoyl-tripeptide--D-alanyl-D-alanine ligase [Rhodospirillales bacterium]
MTALWTAKEAAGAVRGRSTQDWSASGVSIDSRSVVPGDLFVAIRGPNVNGHRFVGEALSKGAVAAMVESDWAGAQSEPDLSLLIVEDTMAGLNALARAARDRGSARIAAVTGSVGKTSTKDALAHALAAQGRTAATLGNLNNQWGLPLSLARMPARSDFGVFELGMNHPGELTPLSRLLRPDLAIITAVESVHLEFFDSEEAIADAKAEIFAGLVADGAALLNADNRHFDRLRRAALEAGAGRVLSFGETPDADYRLLAWSISGGGSRVEAAIDGQQVAFDIGAPGRHWAMIGVIVLGAAALLGADVARAADSLAAVRAPKGRGLHHRVALAGGAPLIVIDESYNASPASMRAAISVLGAMEPGPGGRRIAVLGDMLELGEDSGALHAALAADLEAQGVDLVFAAGPDMARLFEALPASMRGAHAAQSEGLTDPLMAAVGPGDIVTVKGSLGSRMAPLVDALRALADEDGNGGEMRSAASGRG